jgi:DNA mismatch endonuclease, patch repair protein
MRRVRNAPTRLVPPAPAPTNPAVTAVMRGNRAANTKPELIVRRILHRLGYRFRLHVSSLPGRPDIVVPGRRCVIQVRGCFWHQHADRQCPLVSTPHSNVDYWGAKLKRNVDRDREQDVVLATLGWRVFTVWECETANTDALCTQLKALIASAKSPRSTLEVNHL